MALALDAMHDTSREERAPPNKRLKLAARLD